MISKKLKSLDVIIIAAILLAFILLAVPKRLGGGEDKALYVIYDGGEQTYSLSGEVGKTVEVVSCGITVKIRIEKGTAYIESSDCPNGICVSSPAVKNNGDSIVCAPASLAIIVKEIGGDGNADAIAG